MKYASVVGVLGPWDCMLQAELGKIPARTGLLSSPLNSKISRLTFTGLCFRKFFNFRVFRPQGTCIIIIAVSGCQAPQSTLSCQGRFRSHLSVNMRMHDPTLKP